ncbi:hypothetical protein [Mycolicibacterium sediminis]|uniref:Outer membrane protein n=1 Tax=Mycolicibacterium sediminis TaxID=1286180 RepID=A0A7I7QYH0_9MYCO|nr:hypothetical protein [Mycolicibacterium sediminis]BBY31378.1 outer membrane protein [Mycolicibacterium sediminis]
MTEKDQTEKDLPTTGDEPESTAVEVDDTDTEADAVTAEPEAGRLDWARIAAQGILPGLLLVLAVAAGYLKYVDNSVRIDDQARTESVQAARDITVAMLSYTPDKVEQQLDDARNRLTGAFQESYSSLISETVIPGAREKQISAVATVPDAASVSADPDHAVALVFVNQTVVVGGDAPTNTASSVRVTLEKSGGKWLISSFEPV